MSSWRRDASELLFSHRIFRLHRRTLACGERRREAMVLTAPDWVNVIALRDDGQVLLVRQYRYGIEAPTLEIPGGMVDEGEEAWQAAARELLEETGYRAGRLELLGMLHPNPAFLANQVGTWLATELELVDAAGPRGDGEEEIEVETAPLTEIPGLIARGEITHALVVAGFQLLAVRGAAAT